MTISGTMATTVYSAAGSYTFTPPDPSIQVVWADIWGAGSGGNCTQSVGTNGNPGGGGGAGELVERKLIPIIGGTLAIVVGAKGTKGLNHFPQTVATSGGLSSVGNVIALGGVQHDVFTNAYRGQYGGGPLGGQPGGGALAPSVRGFREGPCETGGNSGGGGAPRSSGGIVPPQLAPGAYASSLSKTNGGGGGANSQWGPGGDGGTATAPATPGANAANAGTGGGGASSDGGTGADGGDGFDGKVILYYLA